MPQPQKKRRRRPAGDAATEKSSEHAVEFLPPLRPNRKLFYISLALVIACFATLLTLYFVTETQLHSHGTNPVAASPANAANPAPLTPRPPTVPR
jgi:hypothetical protein